MFARMLAKIAWGQPVAEWGRAAFQKVFILDGILGVKQDMGKFGLVGRSLRVLPSPQVKLPQQRHPVCQGVLPGS